MRSGSDGRGGLSRGNVTDWERGRRDEPDFPEPKERGMRAGVARFSLDSLNPCD